MVRDDVGLSGSLIDRCYPAIFNFARRKLGNHHDAEDAVQETFARAQRGLAGFGARGQVATWLFVVSRNTVTDCLRRRRRAAAHPLLPQLIDAGREPEPMAEFRMEDAIDRLPPEDRRLIHQVYREKKTLRRIADENQESLYRVRQRLNDVKNALRASTAGVAD